MRVTVKPYNSPFYLSVETTLEAFFVDDAQQYQDPLRFPLRDPKSHYREGGCTFAFDRLWAPVRCLGCRQFPCHCPADGPLRERFALQAFAETHVVILDLDLMRPRPDDPEFDKYAPLTWDEEQQLRRMEERLQKLPQLAFFYRTKCNGFRLGFDVWARPITDAQMYEAFCLDTERTIAQLTPDGRLGADAWFIVDPVSPVEGLHLRAECFWSYPLVQHPVWLNPSRLIR